MFWAKRKDRTARRKASRLSRQDHKRSTSFTPGVERLESRDVPAVTLSLAAGVLTVNGSTANDSIVVRQLNGRVSVDGNATSYAATGVNSLVVNSGAGNDSVNLQGLTT